MIQVSQPETTSPDKYESILQQSVYETLNTLTIPFWRVVTEPAITMDDCAAIDDMLQVKTVKTLLLCNRQQTDFYLYVSLGDKPFRTKYVSAALGVARLSFAPASFLPVLLGSDIGSTTIFSVLLDSASAVRLIVDREILDEPWYGCSDGTTTGYLKFATSFLFERLLPFAGRQATIIVV